MSPPRSPKNPPIVMPPTLPRIPTPQPRHMHSHTATQPHTDSHGHLLCARATGITQLDRVHSIVQHRVAARSPAPHMLRPAFGIHQVDKADAHVLRWYMPHAYRVGKKSCDHKLSTTAHHSTASLGFAQTLHLPAHWPQEPLERLTPCHVSAALLRKPSQRACKAQSQRHLLPSRACYPQVWRAIPTCMHTPT